MALIFNVESKRLDFSGRLIDLIVVIPKENAVVNLNHEDDVATKEDTVINERSSKAQ
jgi:hypothetical protein